MNPLLLPPLQIKRKAYHIPINQILKEICKQVSEKPESHISLLISRKLQSTLNLKKLASY